MNPPAIQLIPEQRPGHSRHPQEVKMNPVVVEVIEISGSNVRIGITAPRSVPVFREEIWTAVKDENAAAAATDVDLPDDVGSPTDKP